MTITPATLYSEFQPVEFAVSETERAKIAEAAEAFYFGDGGFWSLSVGDFIDITNGDIEKVCKQDGSVFAVYALRRFADFASTFVAAVEALVVPQTAEERAAMAVCREVTTAEAMLIFTRNYFGCQSFKQAATVSLGDYLIARKDAYNNAVAERKMAEIQRSKMHLKK